jgi:hypothetical protein
MYEDGYENITNIDISNTVTKYMEEKTKARCPNMKCKSYILINRLDYGCFGNGRY